MARVTAGHCKHMSTRTVESRAENRMILPKLLTRREAAALLGVSAKTMANWASNGIGPEYFSLCGGLTRYDPHVLRQWLEEQRAQH